MLLSFLFIVEAAAMSAIVAGAAGLIQIPIPMLDPNVSAIFVGGVGIITAFFMLYKIHA